MGLFGTKDNQKKPKEIYKEILKSGGIPLSIATVTYLGGHPNLIANNVIGNIIVNQKGVFFDQSLTNNFFYILTENIVNAEFKTEEQISKDVTLTRLIALGIFAFGLKKKTKEIKSYLTIRFLDEGIENTVLIESKQAGTIASAVMKIRQNFAKENPIDTISDNNSKVIDVADQIRKLAQLRDEGILSEDEFAQQKNKLLNL